MKGQAAIAAALRRIAASQATFVSRGDESGTHVKEQAAWAGAAVTPEGHWYLAAGSGMAATVRLASEKRAYTLTDRGTFLSQRAKLELVVLSEGDPLLRNVYAVIVISPARHPHTQQEAACELLTFLTSSDVQRRIGEYGTDEYGQPLFTPMAAP